MPAGIATPRNRTNPQEGNGHIQAAAKTTSNRADYKATLKDLK
jgi:hypothetical protein